MEPPSILWAFRKIHAMKNVFAACRFTPLCRFSFLDAIFLDSVVFFFFLTGTQGHFLYLVTKSVLCVRELIVAPVLMVFMFSLQLNETTRGHLLSGKNSIIFSASQPFKLPLDKLKLLCVKLKQKMMMPFSSF